MNEYSTVTSEGRSEKMSYKKTSSVLMIGVILAITAIGIGYAQKSDREASAPSKISDDEDKAKAGEEIAKSVAGGLVRDAIAVKESDWILSNGTFVPKMDDLSPSGVFASFKKGEETIHISVFDFGTADRARSAFSMPKSMDGGVEFKFGDRGEKDYVDGRFVGMKFSVGNINVGIGGTNDEKLAERFAGHVLEAIKGIAVK